MLVPMLRAIVYGPNPKAPRRLSPQSSLSRDIPQGFFESQNLASYGEGFGTMQATRARGVLARLGCA